MINAKTQSLTKAVSATTVSPITTHEKVSSVEIFEARWSISARVTIVDGALTVCRLDRS